MNIQNILVKDFTEKEKKKLLNSKVLLFGESSSLKIVLANMLTAGVGRVSVILASPEMLREKDFLGVQYLTPTTDYDELYKIVSQYDVVVDCSVDYQQKFLFNKIAVKSRTPFVYSNISLNYGQITTIIPYQTPCLECLFRPKDLLDFCSLKVDSPIAGAVAALQSQAILNILLGVKDSFENTLVTYCVDDMELKEIKLSFNPDCESCHGKISY